MSSANVPIIVQSLADLVPAEANPVWEHRIRISLTAGERAFVKIMAQYKVDEANHCTRK
jgi:hypothetical protein